jgi:hypothetical protein
MAWWFAKGRYKVTDSFSFYPRISRRAICGFCSLKGFWLYIKKNHTDKRLTHFQTHFVLQVSVQFFQKGTLLPTKLQEVTHFKFYTNLFKCLWLLAFIQMAEQRNTTKLTGEFSNFSFRKASLKDICANFSVSCRQKLFFPFHFCLCLVALIQESRVRTHRHTTLTSSQHCALSVEPRHWAHLGSMRCHINP